MSKQTIKQCVSLAGYVFVFLVSIVAAFQVKDNFYLFVLLIVSAAISLGLAIDRFVSSRRMEKRIQELEDNQLTPIVDDHTLVFKVGKKK